MPLLRRPRERRRPSGERRSGRIRRGPARQARRSALGRGAPARIPTTYATPHLPIRNRYPLYPGTLRAAARRARSTGPRRARWSSSAAANDGTGIIEKFIELAGGPDKKFVIVPTAGGNRERRRRAHRRTRSSTSSRSWLKRGLKNVRMLHTHDPKVADTEEFAKVLRDADAVWFNGGRQWNIVDSYANTLTYREFHKVLERGGVIGGSSAGATIQGDYLVRGDTSGPNVMMTAEPNHQDGVQVPAQGRRSISTSTRATAGTT